MLPLDLPRLRTLVTHLRGELGRTEKALSAAEEAEAVATRRRPRPDPPAWLIERSMGAALGMLECAGTGRVGG
ncbi:hypothetical protein ADK52_29180 [Streptomyces sp. WM6372]|uniref:hypothetical protein n=1 Tax=Streptomyces sp. WM6372 TaxID=1415555 RepID=UPI0006AF1D30|nr:hypothetical protein [Streptomyces sp. WM6372]KOU19122.1 hypothetical protein ADK52_29180 [Streptomyces sp. WM6372]